MPKFNQDIRILRRFSVLFGVAVSIGFCVAFAVYSLERKKLGQELTLEILNLAQAGAAGIDGLGLAKIPDELAQSRAESEALRQRLIELRYTGEFADFEATLRILRTENDSQTLYSVAALENGFDPEPEKTHCASGRDGVHHGSLRRHPFRHGRPTSPERKQQRFRFIHRCLS